MRILLITHTLKSFDGWGRYTLDLKNALEKEHHQVLTTSEILKEKNTPFSSPQSYLLQPFSFRIPFRFLRDIINIRKIIKDINPDIIHITVEPYVFLLPFLSIKRTPVILTVHGTYSYIPNIVRPVFKSFYKYLMVKSFEKVTSIISVSQYTADYLLRNIDLPKNKINIINNGINIDPEFVSNDTTNRAKKIILMVGGVKKRKGIMESLKVLKVFKQTFSIPFEYRIIGSFRDDDQYYLDLVQYITQNNLSDEVVFLGRVKESILESNYKEADLYLMLPIDDGHRFEGFGLVYLEANAYGVPTIGSRNSGAMEAIKNGTSGYLDDATIPEEISQKIFDILQNNSISKEACVTWAREHNLKASVSKYIIIYKDNL